MVPEVAKAIEHRREIKLGKQSPGQVQKVLESKKELKDQIKRNDEHIRDLEKRLDAFEQGETD